MSSFRIALIASQVGFKSLPAALDDPFTRIAREFDAKAELPVTPTLSQIRLPDQGLVVTVAHDRAVVRVENPTDEDEGIAKSLAAWEKLRDRLGLGELGMFSIRVLFIADRSDVDLDVLVASWRRAWPAVPFATEAINWAIVGVYPNLRRRLFFGPANTAHIQQSHQLTVPEQVFYKADVDHVVGQNVQFIGTVRRSEFVQSIRASREYSEQALAAVEASWAPAEGAS